MICALLYKYDLSCHYTAAAGLLPDDQLICGVGGLMAWILTSHMRLLMPRNLISAVSWHCQLDLLKMWIYWLGNVLKG